MEVIMKRLFSLLFVFVFLTSIYALAADKATFNTTPKTNKGKKWQIVFYEGGPYIDYQTTLIATVKGLMNLGWIETTEIPPQKGEQTKELWSWLGSKTKSKYIEFVKDAHYSAKWDKELRKKMAAEVINRLNQEKDIDLIIASGTWAGQDIANDKHSTSTIVVSTSDPLKASIIKSIEDSGFEHVHARVDPYRFERQVRVFHDIMRFKKLGMAYENTPEGKVYAAFDKVEKVAKERGFEIVSCYTKGDIPDLKLAEETVKKCFHELGEKKVDAIYVTAQSGVNKKSVPELAKIANSYKIPTFSQAGSKEVKYGFLMSIAKAGFKANGVFHAETLAKTFNGAKPRQLEQIFESPPKLAINLETVKIIGYDPPMDVLGLVDETY
ncbi:MAG: ABC transporter substrate-binding protein [Desulfobacteraceae bacterium]|nr:ABC transporter substrate-binding protein [Desulfobacteraceae bacterium]